MINGLIIAYLNVTPFITTLGTMIIVYGINSLYYDFVGASPFSGFDSGFSTFAQGFVALGSFRLSYITFYALIAVAFVWVLWNKTRFGKKHFCHWRKSASGKSIWCQRRPERVMINVLSGVFYAFGGMLEAGRIGSATNNLGFMYELDAIAACVVGGDRSAAVWDGDWRGDRGNYFYRHQLWPDVYRRKPILGSTSSKGRLLSSP
ncbi:ABC transporter permease subunit [Escherichia coli]